MTVKQKILRFAYVFRSGAMFCGVLCGSCIAWHPVAAQDMTGRPGETTAMMRLVAGPGLTAGGYKAGVAITMSSGSHTYWKMPGEAGVPPVFSFTGSENIADATVLFPMPQRLTEDGLEAFGYKNSVVFPIRVTPKDPGKPSILRADVTYAVCNKICLPAHDTATLRLEPTVASREVSADLVDAAFTLVPHLATSEQHALLLVTRLDPKGDGKTVGLRDAKPSWTLAWHGSSPLEDIFAEGPEGFFFTTKQIDASTWSLVADQITGPATAVPVSLTLRQKTGGLVVMEKLDVATPIQ